MEASWAPLKLVKTHCIVIKLPDVMGRCIVCLLIIHLITQLIIRQHLFSSSFVVILNLEINIFFLNAAQKLFLKVFGSFLGFVRFVIWGKQLNKELSFKIFVSNKTTWWIPLLLFDSLSCVLGNYFPQTSSCLCYLLRQMRLKSTRAT